ncbi:MAG: hypothetical protein VYD57_08525 [Pseudomonadota bacterium]|nr:hypothetical protein [Pseudomonadota bacterium]
MIHRLVTLLALGVLVSPSFAQSTGGNTLTILQEGHGNSLDVDQSAATGARVNGLTIDQRTDRFEVLVGTRNIYGTDEKGEPVVIGQEDIIKPFSMQRLSPSLGSSAPARQIGANNSATIVMGGDAGEVGLFQDSRGLFAIRGNEAEITALQGSSAFVGQEGGGNRATLNVDALAASGTILQRGFGNSAELNVTGAGAKGLISQIGIANDTNLTVNSPGADVSYVVEGIGLRSINPGGLQVTTNVNAPISIRQSGFGAFNGVAVGPTIGVSVPR